VTVRKFRLIAWFIPLAAIAALLGVHGSVRAGDGLAPNGDLPSAKLGASDIEEKLGVQLPMDLVLRDEQERPTTLRECMAGKPTILVPMYYRCPMLCNLVLKNLVDALREMPQDFTAGGKFNVVAVSFDPKEHADLGSAKKSVVLQEYGRAGAENGWRFLTGNKEAVAELMNVIGYHYEFDKSFKEYNHPSGIIILTPEGKTARYFYGIRYEGEFRIPGGTTTLRLSLIEAADGKGGSMLDQLILRCYRFDHIKGYSLSVLRAVQVGGILTLLAIGTWVALAFHRERRRAYATAASQPVPDEPHTGSGEPTADKPTNMDLPSGGNA
jgi:protein SCO1/2